MPISHLPLQLGDSLAVKCQEQGILSTIAHTVQTSPQEPQDPFLASKLNLGRSQIKDPIRVSYHSTLGT